MRNLISKILAELGSLRLRKLNYLSHPSVQLRQYHKLENSTTPVVWDLPAASGSLNGVQICSWII